MQKVYCVTPLYNDWPSCAVLADKIMQLEGEHSELIFNLVIVNDGSVILPEQEIFQSENIKILNLKVNVGHQRAIAVGLQYVYNEVTDCDAVVVLDSDGEDRPEDIPLLLEKSLKTQTIVFAERNKREESLMFKTGYWFYKILFNTLTGKKISFGNFSAMPFNQLKKVVALSNIWNHYSGAVMHSRLPYNKVLLDRGKRYAGQSKMNFTSLVLHGLSSISVYFDSISVRILKFCFYGIALCFAGVFYILFQKFFTEKAIPGWASSLIMIIMGIILQLFSVTLIVLLLQLSSRKNTDAPNTKKYLDFLED
ncbi:glycosyltransferase [Flavobacterium alkalisoli]|uniref:Glycosyltransferase n=1 Tax=Flavobacterium alkalisoli TaxID=2602769 RepID=A0A5B9FP02_9FLAO|nr:glycosyltransferase [Flavobacterium alkalisoli]QEE48764.1 glycosyltransferase [Flavobacterium alkalisoli]